MTCRNSKLTQLLADSLSGQAKVMMFVHVSPEASSYQESTSSLKFGTRVSDITLGQAKKNVEQVSSLEAKEANVRRSVFCLYSIPERLDFKTEQDRKLLRACRGRCGRR